MTLKSSSPPTPVAATALTHFLFVKDQCWGKAPTEKDALAELRKQTGNVRGAALYRCPADYYIDEFGTGHGSASCELVRGKDQRSAKPTPAPRLVECEIPNTPLKLLRLSDAAQMPTLEERVAIAVRINEVAPRLPRYTGRQSATSLQPAVKTVKIDPASPSTTTQEQATMNTKTASKKPAKTASKKGVDATRKAKMDAVYEGAQKIIAKHAAAKPDADAAPTKGAKGAKAAKTAAAAPTKGAKAAKTAAAAGAGRPSPFAGKKVKGLVKSAAEAQLREGSLRALRLDVVLKCATADEALTKTVTADGEQLPIGSNHLAFMAEKKWVQFV